MYIHQCSIRNKVTLSGSNRGDLIVQVIGDQHIATGGDVENDQWGQEATEWYRAERLNEDVILQENGDQEHPEKIQIREHMSSKRDNQHGGHCLEREGEEDWVLPFSHLPVPR